MEREVAVRKVEALQTRSGTTRYVLTDEDGNEYTTFKPDIGERAAGAQGRRARIEYHEQRRGNYDNVYLDAVEVLDEDERGTGDGDDRDVDEAAWSTAIEAAPWLLGSKPPDREVPPEEFFDKLKPFKDLVADDIKDPGGEEPG